MLTTDEIDEAVRILNRVRRGAPLLHSTIHGEPHWQAVARIGLRLAVETPGAEPRLAALFAILHDCRRENDHYDPDHGRRAAGLLDELRASDNLALPHTDFARLRDAVALHNDGETSVDPAIGVCWDADRLCLPRVGIEPEDELLSTRAGRRGRDWARVLIDESVADWRVVLDTYRGVRWREELAASSDAKLVLALNREVGNPGWVRARGEYLIALRQALNSHGLDYSAVDGLAAYPGKRKFALRGRQLVYADQTKTDSADRVKT
jgi:uncharacterized protein